MTENMKKFLEAVSKNSNLAATTSAMTKGELLALAKELGIELTGDDFAQETELEKDELEAVTGGWKDCFCIAGGGGKADEDGKTCACVAVGGGPAKDGQNRCWCIGAGSGDKPLYAD